MKAHSSPATSRIRYGALRPFAPQILEWCAQGIDWPLIQARLAELGVTVRIGTLWGYAHHQGWMLIHPYSKHYDDVLAYRFSQGDSRLRPHDNMHNKTSRTTPDENDTRTPPLHVRQR